MNIRNIRRSNLKLLGVIIVTQFLLCSCSTSYHKNFDCNAGRGHGCKSVSEVNSYVNQGKVIAYNQLRIWVAPDHKLGELEGSYQYLDKVEVSK
jgi:hypothetical protein